MHDPRPRRAGSALVRQGPALLCAISRLVPCRDELRSGAGPAIALPVEARRTSAKWDEALQYNGGGGEASSAQHRSCFLPARLPKVQTAHCKLTTLHLVLLLNWGREHVAMGFIICHRQIFKSQWGNPMDLIHLPLLICIWKDWL